MTLRAGCFLLALLAAAGAQAAAARVDFSFGAVTVAGRAGERPVAKGIELDSGDVVRTGANGRAQLRFTDGGFVSLQPNTEFRIDDYRFQGKADGTERGLFALTRGAMRTVTGLVGRVNRDAYKVTTPTATVGIRGTGGLIQVLGDGTTQVTGTSGIWSLTNQFGTLTVPAGFTAFSPSGGAPQNAPGGPPPATGPGTPGGSSALPPPPPPPPQPLPNPLPNVPHCSPAGCQPNGQIITDGGS